MRLATTSNWNDVINETYADKNSAIGGPTWELFAASWNDYKNGGGSGKATLPTNYSDQYGWRIDLDGSTVAISLGSSNQAPWFNQSISNNYWFASPGHWSNQDRLAGATNLRRRKSKY